MTPKPSLKLKSTAISRGCWLKLPLHRGVFMTGFSILLFSSLIFAGCRPQSNQSLPTQAVTSKTQFETALEESKTNLAKAADLFLNLDLTNAPLFSTGSPLSYSEAEFVKLPRDKSETIATHAYAEIALIKQIVSEVKVRRDGARASGNDQLVRDINSQLERLAQKLEGPDNLAVTQLVGKSVQKIVSQ